MSQAVRTLAEADVYVRRYTSRRQRRRAVRNGVLLLAAIAALTFVWITRDNWPMERFVAKDAAFQVCATDLLLNRKEIAASRVWELAPADSPVPAAREALAGNLGMPEWVINNLAYGLGLVSGPDLRDPSSAIFVTRISRIGCLLERLRGFVDGVEDDLAGGLELRHVADASLYYSLRGRVLVASRSRDALVHALTLPETEALPAEGMAAVQQAASGRNLLVTLRPGEDEPGGAQFERLDLTFALKPDAAQLDCKAVPRPAFVTALDGFLNGANTPTLQAPIRGPIEIALDFGRPFTEVWSGLQLAFPGNPALEAVRGGIDSVAEMAGGRAPMLAKALGALGTGLTLTWTGVDPLEIVPVPMLVARIDAPDAAGYEVLLKAGLPRAPVAEDSAIKPYFDDTDKLAIFPVAGGPTMHPAIAMRDKKILLTTSAALARDVIAQRVPLADDGAQGHLLVRVRVPEAAAATLDAAQELADSGFLKGYSPEGFREFAAGWRRRAAQLDTVTGLLAYTNGALQCRITLAMAPPAPQEAAAPAPAGE